MGQLRRKKGGGIGSKVVVAEVLGRDEYYIVFFLKRCFVFFVGVCGAEKAVAL